MPMIPFGQWRPDVSDHQADHIAELSNVVPRADGYGPVQEFEAYSDEAPAACRGLFRATRTDGTPAIFYGTINHLYLMNNTTQAWEEVSKGAVAYTDLSINHNWQFAQFGDFVIAVQANSVPQMYDLTGSTNFADLGGSPPQASYIAIVGRFVVLTGLLSEPYRVQWSDLNDPADWSTGSSDFQDLPDGGIVRGVAGGEYGTIFQDGSIRRMIFVPGSPLIFQIERVSEEIGIYAPYSIVRSGHRVFFLSTNGFHVIGPGGTPEPIGRARVDRTVLGELDTGNLQLVIGTTDPKTTLVYWCYPATSGESGLYDNLLAYDYVLDRWSLITHGRGEYIASLSQPGITLDGLDTLYTSIDDIPGSLDQFPSGTFPEIASVNSSHRVGFYSGINLEANIETSEMHMDSQRSGNRVFVRGFRVISDAPTVYGSVSSRENAGASRTYSAETPANTQGVCPQRVSTKFARGKIRIPEGTSWTFAQGIEPDLVTLGTK